MRHKRTAMDTLLKKSIGIVSEREKAFLSSFSREKKDILFADEILVTWQ